MKIPYFNVTGARKTLINNNIRPKPISGRRQFVKTMGLGALAVNPAVDLIQTIAREPFTINTGDNFLTVVRHGLKAWELNSEVLGRNAVIRIKRENGGWYFEVENACFPGTDYIFSFSGNILPSYRRWVIHFISDELQADTSVDFIEFLDNNKSISGKINGDILFSKLSEDSKLAAKGALEWELTTHWKMTFKGNEHIFLTYCGHKIPISEFSMKPKSPIPGFIYAVIRNGTRIEMLTTGNTPFFLKNLQHNHKILFDEIEPTEQLIIYSGIDRKGNIPSKILYTHASEKNISYDAGLGEPFRFRGYFFSAFFSDVQLPQFYLSSKLCEGGQWIGNPIGSFALIRNNNLPDFEAYGYGNQVVTTNFEPRLKAFLPNIEGGFSQPSFFADSPVIRIEDQQPVRRTINPAIKNVQAPTVSPPPVNVPEEEKQQQDPVRPQSTAPAQRTAEPQQQDPVRRPAATQPVREAEPQQQDPVRQATQPTIQVGFDKIRFRPRKAMSLKVLRPEDLVWLEFEFHNFKFSNKGQSSYLELDNQKEPGVVVIQFPTQHTLEEAWYETTSADTGKSEEIRLPARHIRAQQSRLVYELEAGHPGFELTMEQLMDWSKYRLRVHPRAWIKLPELVNLQPVTFSPPSQRSATTFVPVLPSTITSNDFGLRIAEKSPSRIARTEIYNETALTKILPADRATSLGPTFDISKLKVDMKVGPIPALSTSVEAPALLYISPNQVNDFNHLTSPKFRDVDEAKETGQAITTQFRVLDPLNTTKGEVTELWHTALGIKLGNRKVSLLTLKNLLTIRALWAFDAKADYRGCAELDQPFQASLDASDRHKLVHTTSNYSIQGFAPIPVPIRKLMLSTLGAYIDLHAFFKVPPPVDTHLNVVEWQHLATLGRDHYVKIVREGYLFPLGHRAALVKVTERKFDTATRAAVNKMRMYIVVLEREVIYRRNDAAGNFIKFPFQAVRIENETTPDIDKPVNISLSGGLQIFKIQDQKSPCPQKPGRSTTYNFYIHVGGKGFPFDVTTVDKEGVEQKIRMPLAFVENVVGRTKSMVDAMIADYNPKKQYTDIAFNGQEIAYAESLVDGDTAFETELFTFGAQYYPAQGEASLKFHPMMQSARVQIRQVNELTGNRKPATIQLEDDNNEGSVFARVSGAVVDFTGGSDKAGGFLTPNMGISGLSKLQGPIGGEIEDMMNLDFIPEKFFKAMESLPMAKIFGVIDLFSLLKNKLTLKGAYTPMINQVKAAKQEIEKLKNELLLLQNEAKETGKNLESQINQKKNDIKTQTDKLLKAINDQVPKVPNLKSWFTTDAFYAEYKWIPEFEKEDISLFGGILGVRIDKPKEALQITTTLKKPFDGAVPSSLTGNAKFSNFGIKIADALIVNFNHMSFISGTAQKTDVKVDLNKSKPIEFVGALSFVNNLQSLIPSTGFSDDGPYIELSSKAVKAGFNLSVPDVEVGVFMISNITLGAYVNLPFNGDELTFGFNFCKRENPFMLTVSCFGGGGYFMMVTTLKGLKSCEAAFEFGAAISMNLGVASGGVSVMGGFYFKFEIVSPTQEELTLTGYLRINGNLSVLGIITLSLEFYLALTAVYVDKAIGPGQKVKKVEKMEGVAILKVKVEVLFFSKTVSITVRRQFAGADADPNFADMIPLEDWQEYCLAYEG